MEPAIYQSLQTDQFIHLRRFKFPEGNLNFRSEATFSFYIPAKLLVLCFTHTCAIMCAVIGFMLQEFQMCQNLILLFTVVNAFMLVMKNKEIPTGAYDWRLLVISSGAPALFGSILEALGLLGPGDAW